MLVLDRTTGEISHRMFADFPGYLSPGDLVVLNNSRVIRARMHSDDGRVELLFLEELAPQRWKCLVKPGRRMRLGATCDAGGAHLTVLGIDPTGERIVESDRPIDFSRGELPIPPYMHRPADAEDDARYQTVFAGPEGSVAAPTAGLHFTPEILARIPHAFLTLHVGIGTFQPVKTEHLADHVMHEERYTIDAPAADAINAARRIVAIGTTSTRVLESQPPSPIQPHSGRTAIFIRPPATLHRVGALLTNFHLPKSTLLMLVSAFAGRENILHAYDEAIREQYRFFSYGDCMLIL
jgi:S-adenosylmethionine:tRNA ribosyltransferase-isomerase